MVLIMEKVSEIEKPRLIIKRLTLNDGTTLELEKNSIVVFTGANNCGKSQVLKDIENETDSGIKLKPLVLSSSEIEFIGNIDNESFLKETFTINDQGYYQLLSPVSIFTLSTLKHIWSSHNLQNGLSSAFVKRLGTEKRLTLSNAMNRNGHYEGNPIYKLSKSENIASQISDYFHEAFGEDLVVNRNEMQTIPLHVGTAPDKKSYTMDQHDDYYKLIAELPQLQDQGDGMRSFASVLLDTFTSDYSITLIDEPEAFLHPPQARILGKMLARHNPQARQLFISTHSEDFLQGLLDANNDNVTVIRIDRHKDINKMSILENEKIKNLWGNPILKYSNILSGLFHEKVVVCESDYDCLFYQALMDSIYEENHEISPDILFTHCGGKNRIKDVVAALKAVNVSVIAITDFDILNLSQNMKPLAAAFKLDWDTQLKDNMKVIYDSMNAKGSNNTDPWEAIKKIGKAGFSGEAPAAYEHVENKCKAAGLYIVPVGEMECFDKTVNKEKKEWVYHILENYDLSTEPKLEEARRFIMEIAMYK